LIIISSYFIFSPDSNGKPFCENCCFLLKPKSDQKSSLGFFTKKTILQKACNEWLEKLQKKLIFLA
jgi:hypothetical protein